MFRSAVFLVFLLLNLFAYFALRRTVFGWVNPPGRGKILSGIALVVFLLNIPLAAFFVRRWDASLHEVPLSLLRLFFYPAAVWLTTIVAFFLIAGPPALVWTAVRAVSGIFRNARRGTPADSGNVSPPAPVLSRRSFVVGSAGLLIPGIYGVAAYGVYGNSEELDISPEHSIPIAHLPSSLEGLTIVQISDLHVGPYIREKELQQIVRLTNQLRPDLVVITGDVLDRHLSSLPDAVRGLSGFRSSLGVFAVLGNHDIYSDPYSFSKHYRGGIKITEGLEFVGIRTLRNQVVHLGSGSDRLALMGLDWLTSNPTSRNFFAYRQAETIQQLQRMAAEVGPETPRVLLAHHPDTFADAIPFEIGLTLAGHTHGGGQVVLGHVDGVPIGIGMFRFKYLSGLYQDRGCSLYVNRGIGYLGVPIRINCPPEISRFKLGRVNTN